MRTGDERKPTGTVMMTMVQSSGQWLNGAMVPQHHYVALEIKDIGGNMSESDIDNILLE